jgi:hypothetical protein
MGWFTRSLVGVAVKLLGSFGLVLHRDTKPSLCEGRWHVCITRPITGRGHHVLIKRLA